MRRAAWMGWVVVLLVGCFDGSNGDGSPVAGSTETGGARSWGRIESGWYSHYESKCDSFLAVREAAAWSFLYRWVAGPGTAVPDVDFQKDLVAAAILGMRPNGGYSVDVVDVKWTSDTATYYIEETVPGLNDIVTDVITRPYVFVRLTAPTGAVTVVKDWLKKLIIADETTLALLATDDVLKREKWPIPPGGEWATLGAGICPVDGATLAIAPLSTGAPFPSWAYYCVAHGEYWVKNEPVGAIDPIPWVGPFAPGVY